MRVSLNWLKEYVDIPDKPEELAHRLTMLGLEIESIERPGDDIKNVYVGQILSIERHPDADKIVICKTDVGGEHPLQICCGATNMKVGDKVPTAIVGATLPGGFAIGRRKMRGIESEGMMCSARELGLGEEHDGLLILSPTLPLGADAKSVLGLDDVIFDIEVTPNRGDWASMIGIARELAACYGTEIRRPSISLQESAPEAASLASITINAPEHCPRYLGRVLRGLQVGPSPEWMAKRLHAAGMRPINNIVDITNYVLLETGHPLHAFDHDKLVEGRIVVRRATSGEPMRTLDGQDRQLSDQMLVIADAREPQCVAGVMGGTTSEVGEGTVNVLLESAVFNPSSIRATSRGLGLISESSQRFQRGSDAQTAAYALDRAAALMHELAGATVAQGVLDSGEDTGVSEPRSVTLRFDRTTRLLGIVVEPGQQVQYLERLGFKVISRVEAAVTFQVPAWRHDVAREADLIEEIARLYGFDNIPATIPRVRRNEQIFAPREAHIRQLRRHLVSAGLTELYTWTFSSKALNEAAGLSTETLVQLQNPLSEKHEVMRGSLIPQLLQTAAYNINRGQRNIAAFEIGPVYIQRGNDTLPEQRLRLGLLLAGDIPASHWSSPAAAMDFYDVKGYVEELALFMKAPLRYSPVEHPALQPGQAAEVRLDEQVMGCFGKVQPAIQAAFDLTGDVFLAEIDLEAMLSINSIPARFEPIPTFPPAARDLALLVPEELPVQELIEQLQAMGGRHLRQVEVFDVYHGEHVPTGMKSVALHLRFQSTEETLTDETVQKSVEKALKKLQNSLGVHLR